jgi:hypothetical protein
MMPDRDVRVSLHGQCPIPDTPPIQTVNRRLAPATPLSQAAAGGIF